jgi:hypothetical protein
MRQAWAKASAVTGDLRVEMPSLRKRPSKELMPKLYTTTVRLAPDRMASCWSWATRSACSAGISTTSTSGFCPMASFSKSA